MTNLAIDIGNTRAKLGLFQGENLVDKVVWPEWGIKDFSTYTTNHTVESVILSSTAGNKAEELDDFLRSRFRYLKLDHLTPLPILNTYKTPETLGKDRLAAVVGAQALFPEKTCLVIDAGTCITLDVLESGTTFLGGNISPGLDMRLNAMHTFTAALPRVEKGPFGGWIGDRTETALRNGAQWGALLEIEGMISLAREHFGEIIVILTGGDADFLANQLKSEIFAASDLVLQGLNKILIHNVKHLA